VARFRVREGRALPRHGKVHAAGAVVELEPAVAADPAVAHLVEPVVDPKPAKPERPQPVALVVPPTSKQE
jgi:hypothetical protein